MEGEARSIGDNGANLLYEDKEKIRSTWIFIIVGVSRYNLEVSLIEQHFSRHQ
jgi:hypothetical protein